MSTMSKCFALCFSVVTLTVAPPPELPVKAVSNYDESSSTSSSPNILYILMDDMGYGDISARGAEFSTPNIDKLYKNSIIMNKHYIGLVCSPTRAQILTGRFAWNYGTSYQKAFNDATLMSMPAALPTIADLLNEYTNYNSYITGKWQLGSATYELTPLYRGFKHFYGFYTSGITYDDKTERLDSWGASYIDWWVDDQVDWDTQYEFSTQVTGNKIMQLIEQNEEENELNNEDKPWFIYAAFQAVHETMVDVEEKSTRCSNSIDDDRLTYCENVIVLDDVIGELVTYLKDNNYWDNTMIIFTSDNGGPGHTTGKGSSSGSCNYPLRGAKGNFFEAGVRTIAFVGGGYIPDSQRGTERDEFFHVVDWLPTILSIAGADVDAIADDIQTKLYSPISESLSIQKHGNLLHRSRYYMDTSLDGIDLSDWLINGGSNSRDHVPLSVASYDSAATWSVDDDILPENGLALVFNSAIDGNTYKFIFTTDKQNDVIRRTYCTGELDNDDEDSYSLCSDKDSIKFSNKKLLFLHNQDPYEEINLFEEYGNAGNKKLVNHNKRHKVDSLVFELEKEYTDDLLDQLWEEALNLLDGYKDDNVMFNDVLGCQMNTYYDEADPSQFEVNAVQPWFTWDEYVENWENDCLHHANTLLMELFTTRWYQYNNGEMDQYISELKKGSGSGSDKSKHRSEIEEENDDNMEDIVEEELNGNVVKGYKNSSSYIGYSVGGLMILATIFAIYKCIGNGLMKSKVNQFNEYTPLRNNIEA